jgi:predicted nucleic acid-binding protein
MRLASRAGRVMSIADGMIAAIATADRGCLATRKPRDFALAGVELVSPWEF